MIGGPLVEGSITIDREMARTGTEERAFQDITLPPRGFDGLDNLYQVPCGRIY